MARLEAEGENKTLKNIEITLNQANSGLIQVVNTSLKNINFDNIHIMVNPNKDRIGVIANNQASIQNVKFLNITIENQNASYIGMIAQNGSNSIQNVILQNIQLFANNYVAGLIPQTKEGDFQQIEANEVHIQAKGDNIGGVFGYVNQQMNTNAISEIHVRDSEIVGHSNVGGIFGQGGGSNLIIENSNIVGTGSCIGGVTGYLNFTTRKVEANSINVKGVNYVGGIFGLKGYSQDTISIQDSKVEGKNYIGGIVGFNSRGTIGKTSVIRTNIIGSQNSIGAIIGYLTQGDVIKNYARDCKVEGYSNVGGIIGYMRSGNINACYHNSEIIAYEQTAGGIVGKLDNTGMSAVNYTSKIYANYVVGSKIKGKGNIGGMIGGVVEDLYSQDYFKQNLIEAYLESDNAETMSLGIGSNPDQIKNTDRIYIYQYSTLNQQNPSSQNDVFKEWQLLNSNKLKEQATYDEVLGWMTLYLGFNYSPLKENCYPFVAETPNQVGIKIPT